MTDTAFDYSGSAFDNLLAEEDLLDDAEVSAVRRVIAWQLTNEMVERAIDRAVLAERMGSSRAQVDRLLDAEERDMDLSALTRAARALGKRLRIDMVDAA